MVRKSKADTLSLSLYICIIFEKVLWITYKLWKSNIFIDAKLFWWKEKIFWLDFQCNYKYKIWFPSFSDVRPLLGVLVSLKWYDLILLSLELYYILRLWVILKWRKYLSRNIIKNFLHDKKNSFFYFHSFPGKKLWNKILHPKMRFLLEVCFSELNFSLSSWKSDFFFTFDGEYRPLKADKNNIALVYILF